MIARSCEANANLTASCCDEFSVAANVGKPQVAYRETVRKMVEASIRGWRKYLESSAETNEYIHQQNPEMELDILEFGAEAMKPLYTDDETPLERLGTMTAARWKTLSDQLVEVEVLKPGEVDPQRAFTTQFLLATDGTPDAE